MRIGAASSAYANFNVPQIQQQNTALTLSEAARRQQIAQTRSTLLDLRRSINEALRFFDVGRLRNTLTVDTTDVTVPGGTLGLDLSGTASTLTSTQEINTRTTSFETRGPSWELSSTAQVTIGGQYTGTIDQTLRFDATVNASNGNITIDVTDAAGTRTDRIQIQTIEAPGQVYTLTSGLTFSIPDFNVVDGDGFDLDVSATVGTDLDPTNPFNGSRLTHPELDDGFNAGEANAIVDGSFTLNGTTIQVFASDSLTTLLDRINAAGAGATAAYDAANDTVVFTATDVGSDPITLANDTSGILAALKLDGATTAPGDDSDLDKPLDQLAAFGGVSAGTVTINGATVAIDPTVDTLNTLLPLLDGADPNVGFALVDDRIQVTVNGSADLSDDNGFFAAIGLSSGTIVTSGNETGSVFSTSRARTSAEAIREIFDLLDDILREPLTGGVATSQVRFLRNDIRNALAEGLDADGKRVRTDFGLTLDLRDETSREVRFGLTGSRRLVDALRRGDQDPVDYFLGVDEDEPGLLERLDVLVETNLKSLNGGSTLGLRADVRA